MPFGIQPVHILVVLIVALIIFGPKRLPQIGRWIGRTFMEFRKGAREMTEGFKEEAAKPVDSKPDGTGAPSADASGGGGPRPGESRSPGAGGAGSPATDDPNKRAGPYCTRCGAANPPDSRFCNKCGARLVV